MMNRLEPHFIETDKKNLEVSHIKEGIVLDHIPSGEGIKIFNHLVLNMLDCSIALFVNLPSPSLQAKDIITVESSINMNIDFLASIDPNITINIVSNHQVVNKIQIISFKNMAVSFC